MNEYGKLLSLMSGIIVATITFVVQWIATDISSDMGFSLLINITISTIVGAVSFVITIFVPRLINRRKKSLCGLYLITYPSDTDVCSVVSIELAKERLGYSIDVYDCISVSGEWRKIKDQHPQNLSDVYYDLHPKKLHLISNDENKKSCIFIRFHGKDIAAIIRYGSSSPFDKPHDGIMKRLTRFHICEAYNNGFDNYEYCNLRRKEGEEKVCKSLKLRKDEYCKGRSLGEALMWVSRQLDYTKIPKHLHREFIKDHKPAWLAKEEKGDDLSAPLVSEEVAPSEDASAPIAEEHDSTTSS